MQVEVSTENDTQTYGYTNRNTSGGLIGNAYRVGDSHMDKTVQHAGGQLVHNLDHGLIVILRAESHDSYKACVE